MRSADPGALNAADRARLAAILGRLGSDFPGERDAAALAATKFVRTRGVQWCELLTPTLPPPATAKPFDLFDHWPQHWRAAVHLCQAAPATLLTPWERQFVATLARYKFRPSDPQSDILATITGRVLAGGAA